VSALIAYYMSNLQPNRFPWKRVLMGSAKLILVALVLYFAGGQILDALSKARAQRIRYSFGWLAASGGLYSLGMALFGVFWRRTLVDMGGRIGLLASLRTYFISQLGKYVPGKAWVVLMRCMLAGGKETPPATVAVSAFYETFAIMGIGALIALPALAWAGTMGVMLPIALALAAAFLIAVQPPVFSRLVALVALPFKKKGDQLAKPVGYSTLWGGVHFLIGGWVLIGLSALAAGAGTGTEVLSARSVVLAIGAMALGTVGGFVVIFIPAGFGAREWLLMKLLEPALGPAAAVIAVTVRLVQIGSELILGGVLFLVGRRKASDG